MLFSLENILRFNYCRTTVNIKDFSMLKHGGLAANGNCVAFPQDVSEPGKFVSKTL
jgi:hypothetical protein